MRELVNFDSGERLGLGVEDKALVSVSLKSGKTKQTKKEFASEQEAKKACIKREWESLKKGFILQDSEAKAGKACLHVYIGGGYTGALSFASVRDEIYVYKCGGQKDGGMMDDLLVRLDKNGLIKEQIALPKPLAWHAECVGENLLLDLDHEIYSFEPKSAKFRQISVEQNLKRNNEIASFICASNNVAIFGMFGQIFAFRDGEISKIGECKCIEKSYAPILCAALSADASMLALCTKENEVQILNAKNGEILSEVRAEFGALDKICFLDDETLLVRKYLENKLFCVDIKSAKVIKQPWIKDEYLRASEFCVEAGKLVVVDQSRVYAANLKSGDVMAEFTLDHVVKSCEAKFIDGKLAVRTDYGCFSLYEI
ncbi:hypothetical protein [Campylobacter concisus]|uniref:WD40 repeat domain-containing protein n=1 Tax=Campylobacter concisus TaxID=199 RepID=A0A7S9WVN4_9BACT|nr:hypothetical protein [Campylobacter concisus]QPH95003.1 hypothetical protein CVT08_06065 [Campylobacter concisus]